MMFNMIMNKSTASYDVKCDGQIIAKLTFPSDVICANFGNVCFYDNNTGTFLGTTHVNVGDVTYTLERVA